MFEETHPTLPKVDIKNLAYIGARPGSGGKSKRDSDSWFTPILFTEMAKKTMGDIDLDPFSSGAANARIKAQRFFDKDDDAFKKIWFETPGRVFMNPPYSRKTINAAVEIFLEYWTSESISQAIVLVNNATETRWFQSLLRACTAVCFPERRIAFENDDGKHVSGNTRGQAFFYYGCQLEKFSAVFKEIGAILPCCDPGSVIDTPEADQSLSIPPWPNSRAGHTL